MTYTEERQEIMNSAELCKQRDEYIRHIQALQSVLLSATSFDIAAEKRKMKVKHNAGFVLLLVLSIFSATVTLLCLLAKFRFSSVAGGTSFYSGIYRICNQVFPFAAIAAIILFTVYIVLATIRQRKINEKIKKPVEDNQRILATAGKSLAEDTEKLMNFEASMRNECVIPEKYWRYGFQIGNRLEIWFSDREQDSRQSLDKPYRSHTVF